MNYVPSEHGALLLELPRALRRAAFQCFNAPMRAECLACATDMSKAAATADNVVIGRWVERARDVLARAAVVNRPS